MKCSVSGSSRVGVLFLSFCILNLFPLFLIQKTNIVAKLDRNIFYYNDFNLYNNPFDGSICTNDGDTFPYFYKDNEIGVGEITNDDLPFEKCAAFCRPYVEHKGYVGFGTALNCFLEANCNRCSCYFDAGFLPDTDFDEWTAEANNVVGPVNGAIGLPGSNDKCYPYKVSLLCNRSIIDSRRSLYNIYSLFTYRIIMATLMTQMIVAGSNCQWAYVKTHMMYMDKLQANI